MEELYRKGIGKCHKVIGFILRKHFGLPIPCESRLCSSEFVLFRRHNHALFVYVGDVIDNHTLDEVRQLFDRSDRHDFNPDVFLQTDLNGIATVTLTFNVATSEHEYDRVTMRTSENEYDSLTIVKNGKSFKPTEIGRSTYGELCQPGWGDFPDGVFYLYTDF